MDENAQSNRTILIQTGVCEIYKSKSRKTNQELKDYIGSLDSLMLTNTALMDLLHELGEVLQQIPDSKYPIGYVGEGQVVNLEGFFSESGAGLFSYRVRSPVFEYYTIDSSQAKKYLTPHICKNLLELITNQLKHRVDYLKKKNNIVSHQQEKPLEKPKLESFAANNKLLEMIQQDYYREFYSKKDKDTVSKKIVQLGQTSVQNQRVPQVLEPKYMNMIKEHFRYADDRKNNGGISRKKILGAGGFSHLRGAKDFVALLTTDDANEERSKRPADLPLKHKSAKKYLEKNQILSVLQSRTSFSLMKTSPAMLTDETPQLSDLSSKMFKDNSEGYLFTSPQNESSYRNIQSKFEENESLLKSPNPNRSFFPEFLVRRKTSKNLPIKELETVSQEKFESQRSPHQPIGLANRFNGKKLSLEEVRLSIKRPTKPTNHSKSSSARVVEKNGEILLMLQKPPKYSTMLTSQAPVR